MFISIWNVLIIPKWMIRPWCEERSSVHCVSSQTDWASIKTLKTEPSWESTHAVTSPAPDKLVVPEEKMADHEEQLSDEEKVRCPFNNTSGLQRDTVLLGFWVAFVAVSARTQTFPGVIKSGENPGLSSIAAASALIIFSSTSARLRISNWGSLYGPASK